MLYRVAVFALFAAAAAFQAPVSMTQASSVVARSASAPRFVMMADEVEDKVKGIIAEQLGVELDTVVPGASFTEDLGADSLDAVELIMAIEEAFDIEIPDEEAETMTTPADCVTAIKAKLG